MDYNEIIDNLTEQDIIRIMQELGVTEHKETPEALIFPTVCHNEDASEASYKLYYYKDNHFFYCYTECGGMTVFKMIEHYYQCRGIEYDWYKNVLCLITGGRSMEHKQGYVSLASKYTPINKNIQLPQYDEGILAVFEKIYPQQWISEGITTQAMDKYNILFSIQQNKIIIPHYDKDNRLIGIRGRAINDWKIEKVGKYMPVSIENKIYSHKLSLNLYGLYLNKENIRRRGYCYLFEAEKSVLMLESYEQENCGVAVCGSNFNKYQLFLLLKECNPSEIILCFDKEEIEGDKYFNKLTNICKKYNKYTNFSFVYDFNNRLQLKDSPCDKGERVFKDLIKERVIVK